MVNWEVTDKEAEYVVAVLMRQPFAEVNQLLSKLVMQANRKQEEEVLVPPHQHPAG